VIIVFIFVGSIAENEAKTRISSLLSLKSGGAGNFFHFTLDGIRNFPAAVFSYKRKFVELGESNGLRNRFDAQRAESA
jgi:hypothetical protein